MRFTTLIVPLIFALLVAGCTTLPSTSDQTRSPSEELAGWSQYANADVGFSMMLPPAIFVGSDAQGGADTAPVVAIENTSEHSVFITTGTTVMPNVTEPTKSTLQTTTLALLKAGGPHAPRSWEFKRVTIGSDADLDAFIKKTFGKGCSLDEKKPAVQSGVFDVTIKDDDKPLDETQCPLIVAVFMEYQPSTHTMIYATLGEDVSFLSNENGSVVYDMKMLESFRML